MVRLLQVFRVINSPTFPFLFLVVVLCCTYKIKLELIHIDKTLLKILMKMKM